MRQIKRRAAAGMTARLATDGRLSFVQDWRLRGGRARVKLCWTLRKTTGPWHPTRAGRTILECADHVRISARHMTASGWEWAE